MSALSELVSGFPGGVSQNISDIVLLLKAAGIAAITYFIYVVFMGIFTYRRMRRVEHIEKKADVIEKKVNSIDKKLDKLLKKK